MNQVVELVAVVVLRALQAAVWCLPTLLCGMVVAGVLRAVVGQPSVARWFSRGTRLDLVRAWVFAFFLPTCSIGALPVLVTLRRQHVRWGPLVTVALAGPLVTPWTLGYLLDRLGAAVAFALIAGNAILALLAGLLADRSTTPRAVEPLYERMPSKSVLANMLWAAAKSVDRRVLVLIGLALAGVGVIAACIPPNAVGDLLVERTAFHAIALTGLSLFTYATPEVAAMQSGEVLHASAMPGLIVAMIGLGSAVHLGTLVALGFVVGARRAAVVLAVLLAATGALGYAVDRFTYDNTFLPEHTHAFEDLGRPFDLPGHPDGPIAGFVDRTRRLFGSNSLAAGVAIVGLLAFGRWLDARPAVFDPQWIGMRMAQAAGASFVAGTATLATFTYYPPPGIVQQELRAASAEFNVAYRRNEYGAMQRSADLIDRRLAQLVILSRLHGHPITNEQRTLSAELRVELAALRARHDNKAVGQARCLTFQKRLNALLRTLTARPNEPIGAVRSQCAAFTAPLPQGHAQPRLVPGPHRGFVVLRQFRRGTAQQLRSAGGQRTGRKSRKEAAE